MSSLDKVLMFFAAIANALAVADPFGVFPTWVQAVAGVFVVGFAAIGIYTATPVGASRARRGPPRNPPV